MTRMPTIPGLSDEQLSSIADCDGVVKMTEQQRRALVDSAWFKARPAGHRALMVASFTEWLAPGSNQHKHKPDERSPMAASRRASELIERSSK